MGGTAMPNITSMFLLLAFICLMTGIFSPDIVIKWGIPHLKNRKNILITFSGVIIGCSFLYALNENPMISVTEAASSTRSQSSKPLEKVIYQIGEVGTLHETTLELNSVNQTEEILSINIVLRNHSDEVLAYNPYQFILKTNTGGSLVPNVDDETTLKAGELAPGDEVSGTLIYTYPLDEGYSFEYRPVATNALASITFDLEIEALQVVSQPKVMGIGDMVTNESIDLQVTKVERLNKTELSTPKKGYEYVKVDLMLKNKTDDTLIFFPYHFELSDQYNQKLKPMTSLIETENLLKMTEIVSGGVIEGSLMFEIPKNATNLMLYYTLPTLFSKETLSVNLELEHEVKNTLTPSLSFNENWLFGERLVPIELENMILTVFSYDKVNETTYSKAKDGKSFIIIDVQLENRSETDKNYSAYDFKLLTDKGELILPSLTLIDNDHEFKSGSLAMESSIEGLLIFEVDDFDTQLSLIYSPSQWEHSQKLVIPLS